MRAVKKNPVLNLVNTFFIDSALPSNITYFWNFGSLLGATLILQLASGIFLSMHYVANTSLAFSSVEHIMRDVNNGWLLRYAHANGASMFFILIYLHIGRGLYFGSYTKPRLMLWSVGVVILILLIVIAFLGYVLPWGTMSYWGATVITNLLSAIPWIGTDLVTFIWGNFSVENPTLNRFFSLHFLLPFVLTALVLIHIMALHMYGSNNPLGYSSHTDRLAFHSFFTLKDLVGAVVWLIGLAVLVFFVPNMLGHPDNYIPANPLVTPLSIVPEWYLLPFYAILRAIPDKLGGVIAMLGSLLILLVLPFVHTNKIRSSRFSPLNKILFYVFCSNFFLLVVLGSLPIQSPYVGMSQLSTFIYFSYFIVVALIGKIDNLLFSFSEYSQNNLEKK